MAPESLMGKIDRLKSKKCGVDNYTRFLAPLDDVNERFRELTSKQSFLPLRKEMAFIAHRYKVI
jgi:hypothetical protein